MEVGYPVVASAHPQATAPSPVTCLLLAISPLMSTFPESKLEKEKHAKFKWLLVWQQEKTDNTQWLKILILSVDLNYPYHVSSALAWIAKVLLEWLYFLQGRLGSKRCFESSGMFCVDGFSIKSGWSQEKHCTYNPKNSNCKHGLSNVTEHPWLHS